MARPGQDAGPTANDTQTGASVAGQAGAGEAKALDPRAAVRVEAAIALVRDRLDEAQLAGMRQSAERLVEMCLALESYALRNADEPITPFAAYRAEG